MSTKNNSEYFFKFLEKTYNETFSLLSFARDYFNSCGRVEKAHLYGQQNIAYTLAMSSITVRLTSSLGWLIACKAVQAGEITLQDMQKEEFRMQEFDIKINPGDPVFSHLSKPMRDMLEQSEMLYQRVSRMERAIHKCIEESV